MKQRRSKWKDVGCVCVRVCFEVRDAAVECVGPEAAPSLAPSSEMRHSETCMIDQSNHALLAMHRLQHGPRTHVWKVHH